LHAGVFNAWTEKSLGRLAELVPGRYAKSEMSSGFMGAIDRYVYRSPLAQAAALTASNTATTPTGPNTAPNNSNTTPGNSGALPNSGVTTPGIPDQTTHPAPVHPTDGVVKNANPR
jgi:cellulose synthase operon protein C